MQGSGEQRSDPALYACEALPEGAAVSFRAAADVYPEHRFGQAQLRVLGKRQFLQRGGAYKLLGSPQKTAPWEPPQRTGLGMLPKRGSMGKNLSLKTKLTFY